MSQPSDPNRTVDEPLRPDSLADGPAVAHRDGAAPMRLELLEEIARGGMGAILRGRDADIGRDVAVKVLLEDHRGRPELARRFLEEAHIAGRLQHPGVAPVYALGRMPDGRPYFTMKLIKGRTLTALLAERKDSSSERPRFLAVFEQVCQTLAYAHARGVIHRDLKPSNVMVGAYGEVQVMDWGLAKVLPRDGEASEAGREDGDGGGVADPDAAGRAGHGGGRVGDASGHRDGDAGLHGAGAGPRRSRGRGGAFGRVRAGRDPVRDPDGAAAVRGAERGGAEAGAACGTG